MFKAIDTDGDGAIDSIVVYPYSVVKVTYVGTTTASTTAAVTGASGTITLADDTTYTGMAKGDYAKKTAAINTVSNSITYEKVATFDAKVTATTTTTATVNSIAMGNLASVALGNTYTSIAQVNGFIWAATLSTGIASASNYAVLEGAETDVGSLNTYRQAKLSGPGYSTGKNGAQSGTFYFDRKNPLPHYA